MAAFQAAKATSTLPADPALFGPHAPKVKGGTDLVGDNYFASSTDPARTRRTPIPTRSTATAMAATPPERLRVSA